MHYEVMSISPTPVEESCASIGSPDYPERSRLECKVFERMLQRLFPLPEGVEAKVCTQFCPYECDEGGYREVCVKYQGEQGLEYALQLENNTPAHWDPIAIAELAWYERRAAYRRSVADKTMTEQEVPEGYRSAEPPENVVELLLGADSKLTKLN